MLELELLIDDLRRERALLTNALLEARSEVEQLRTELREAREQMRAMGLGHPLVQEQPRTLLAVTGPDPLFDLDLAALRAVRTATGLDFQTLRNATPEALENRLERARLLGRPIELLHLAVHSDGEQITLGDRGLDAAWLSRHLDGVQVLLLAGCHSDQIGDWLGVVPHVVTLTDSLESDDVSRFTQAFWSGIGQGLHPSDALRQALQRAPAAMIESVERHW